MNELKKNFVNEDGVEETVMASSNDEYRVDLNSNYTLVRKNIGESNKFVRKFKSSFLGSDIGIKSTGFTSVAILATVIALAVFVGLYLIWRF